MSSPRSRSRAKVRFNSIAWHFSDARTGCNAAIDLFANILKAALSSAFGNESCDPIEPAASRCSDRSLLGVAKVPAISDIPSDRSGSSNPRRRHRAKQDDDKTRFVPIRNEPASVICENSG